MQNKVDVDTAVEQTVGSRMQIYSPPLVEGVMQESHAGHAHSESWMQMDHLGAGAIF